MKFVSFDCQLIPPDLDASADDLLDEAYGADDDWDDTDAEPETYRAFLAIDPNGGVAGHLAAYIRRVDQNGHDFDLGMIGNVATRKTHRLQGVAKQLVAEAHSYFLGKGLSFSMLFAYDPPVYMSSNYRLMMDHVHFIDADGQPKTFLCPGSMVCELSAQRWHAGIVNLNGPPV